MQFFFYGTLMNTDRLRSVQHGAGARPVATASVAGTLYDLGEYPGLVLDGAAIVPGVIFDIEETGVVRLDEYEGVDDGLYARRLVRVTAGDDEAAAIDAWTYEYVGPVGNLRPIARWHGPQRP